MPEMPPMSFPIAFTLDIYKIKEGIQRLKRFVESL